ncbi:DEAD/DEAH box helicase family protein [Spirosoma litoris]
MPSNKEKKFETHIADYLQKRHGMRPLSVDELTDRDYHIITKELFDFLLATQSNTLRSLELDYGTDTEAEVLRHLRNALQHSPLWLLIRNGLTVRNRKFQLFYPKPRSQTSPVLVDLYNKNRFTLKTQYHFDRNSDKSVDLVIWLNGLPIVTLEVKHPDEGQTYADAVQQYIDRGYSNQLFELPFLHIAADTQNVKAATNPHSAGNFQWLNDGLDNRAKNEGEYPIEHLYADVLSPDSLLAFLETYLIYVPSKPRMDSGGITEYSPEFTIFPRYHQLRSTRLIAGLVQQQYAEHNRLGQKYLVYHSAGAGKTLTISWMADRLHALYHPRTDNKVFDLIFILTDRKSLDKNIKDDLELFSHLRADPNNPVVGFAHNSFNLWQLIQRRRPIIVTTIQKFTEVQQKLKNDADLKQLNVAFLIDEAHRSQDGPQSAATRTPFTRADQPDTDTEEKTEEEEIGKALKKVDIGNQVLVAFTATPTAKTVATFGDPVDIYYEDEAIREGYILDVAANIISYKTLYNLNSRVALPDIEYPQGVIAKALQDVAYRDEDLIRYKCEIIVKLFKEKVAGQLDGKAKAMVVASSRPAGLTYYRTLQTMLAQKRLPYKVLFAFTNFSITDEQGNSQDYNEAGVNGIELIDGVKVIEDYFDQDEYRILVVANKFQTGFNQPKLCGMFLDKVVRDANAVQTISRLNRNYPGKQQGELLVVDFTNNAAEIIKAFKKFRQNVPYKTAEPDPLALDALRKQIDDEAVFSTTQIEAYIKQLELAEQDSEKDAKLQSLTVAYRKQFEQRYSERNDRRSYVGLLNRFVKLYYFLSNFYDASAHRSFALFADALGQQLLRDPTNQIPLSELLKNVYLERGAVKYVGKETIGELKDSIVSPKDSYKTPVGRPETLKMTVTEFMDKLREDFPITDEEAVVIRQIQNTIMADDQLRESVRANANKQDFIQSQVERIEKEIWDQYIERQQYDKLQDEHYTGEGGIVSLIARRIIDYLSKNNVVYSKTRKPGSLRGKWNIPDNFNEPLDDLYDYMF